MHVLCVNHLKCHILVVFSILGGSENGQWLVEKEKATAAQAELKMEDTSEDSKGTPLLKTTNFTHATTSFSCTFNVYRSR